MINFFKEKIQLSTKDDVIKLHMLVKSYEKGYNLSAAEISTLFELYKTGYNREFYQNCVRKGYFKTQQTVRNSVTKMTKLGILQYHKRGNRSVNETFVPRITESQVIFQYLVGNLASDHKK